MDTLLVVDDDQALLEALSSALSLRLPELKIETCASPRKAMDLLEPGAFHAVLTDFAMPAVNGLEILAHARRVCPLVPVLLMTGHHEIGSQALEEGAYGLIPKPFRIEDVVASVSDAMTTHRLRSKVRKDQRGSERGRQSPVDPRRSTRTWDPAHTAVRTAGRTIGRWRQGRHRP